MSEKDDPQSLDSENSELPLATTNSLTINNAELFKNLFNLTGDIKDIKEIDDRNLNAAERLKQCLQTSKSIFQEGNNLKIKIDPLIFNKLSSLETLKLQNMSELVLSLRDLKNIYTLKHLTIRGPGPNSIQGVQLRSSNLEDLEELTNLEEIELEDQENLDGYLSDLDKLSNLTALRILRCGNYEHPLEGNIESFLEEHSKLKDLVLTDFYLDGDIEPDELKKKKSQLAQCYLESCYEYHCEDHGKFYAFLYTNNGKTVEKFCVQDAGSYTVNSLYYKYCKGKIVTTGLNSSICLIDRTASIDDIYKSVEYYNNNSSSNKLDYVIDIKGDLKAFQFFFRLPSECEETEENDNVCKEVKEINDVVLARTVVGYIDKYEECILGTTNAESAVTDEDFTVTDEDSTMNKPGLILCENNIDNIDTIVDFKFSPEILKKFPNLESIDFGKYDKLKLKLSDLKDLKGLQQLTLKNVIDSYLSELSKISPKLKKIDISGAIKGDLASLIPLTELEKLSLHIANSSEIEGSLASLASLTGLKKLELYVPNEVKLGSLNDISTLTNLEELDISILNIDKDLSYLHNLPKLKWIKLRDFPDDSSERQMILNNAKENVPKEIYEQIYNCLQKEKGGDEELVSRSLNSSVEDESNQDKITQKHADQLESGEPNMKLTVFSNPKTNSFLGFGMKEPKSQIVDMVGTLIRVDDRVHNSTKTGDSGQIEEEPPAPEVPSSGSVQGLGSNDTIQVLREQFNSLERGAEGGQAGFMNNSDGLSMEEEFSTSGMPLFGGIQGLRLDSMIQVSDEQSNRNIGSDAPVEQPNNVQEQGIKRTRTESKSEDLGREFGKAESWEEPYKKQCFEVKRDGTQETKSNGGV